MQCKKILVVEDDLQHLELLKLIFEDEGAQVFSAQNGAEGIRLTHSLQPNLIILDLMLPDLDGFQVCQRIRKTSDVPIICMSGMKREADVVKGLQAGADDYLTKPFSKQILLARCEAALRRSGQKVNRTEFDDGRLKIDFESHQVTLANQRIHLTPVEFQLLVCLVKNAGKTLTYHQLLEHIWGSGYHGGQEYIHVSISTLRTKLGETARKPTYILTVPKVGYCFNGPRNFRNP